MDNVKRMQIVCGLCEEPRNGAKARLADDLELSQNGAGYLTNFRDADPNIPTRPGNGEKPRRRQRVVANATESESRLGNWLIWAHLPNDRDDVDPTHVTSLMGACSAHQIARILLAAGVRLTDEGERFARIAAATSEDRVEARAFHSDEIAALGRRIDHWNDRGPICEEVISPHRGLRALTHLFGHVMSLKTLTLNRLSKLPELAVTNALHLHVGRLQGIGSMDRGFWFALRFLLDNEQPWSAMVGAAGEPISRRELIDRLDAAHRVLFIHDVELLPEGARAVLKSYARRAEKFAEARRMRVVLIQRDKYGGVDEAGALLKSETALPFFHEALELYRRRLGVSTPLEGSTLARIEAFYRRSGDRLLCPAETRFRAACLADPTRLDGYDTTQGAKRLLAPELLDRSPELRLHVEDIETHLPSLTDGELRRVRIEATCLYYSTSEYRMHAGCIYDGMGGILEAQKFSGPGNASEMDGSLAYLTYVNDDVYEMSFPVRAVVQEHWARVDPVQRTRVHLNIGNWMSVAADEDPARFVEREYPFDAPWNQPVAICRAEAVRHFVRAAQTAELPEPMLRMAIDQFGDLGEIEELDLGSLPELSTRSLSMATGQYPLKLELMQLFSQPPLGTGEPFGPPTCLELTPSYRGEWWREAAFSLAMSLRFDEAVRALVRGYNAYSGVSGEDACWARLKMLTAISCFAVEACPEDPFGIAVNVAVGKRDLFRDRLSLLLAERNRLRAMQGRNRKAVRDATFEIYIILAWAETMRAGRPPRWGLRIARNIASWTRHMASPDPHAVYLIDILSWSEKEDDLLIAWEIVERCLFDAAERGLDHENLRLQLRKTSLLRRLGPGYLDVAEAIMDSILVRMERHGASPHLLCEFRIASMRVLVDQGRAQYALAAYGVPAQRDLRGRRRSLLGRHLDDVWRQAKARLKSAETEEKLNSERRAPTMRFATGARPDPLNSVVLLEDKVVIDTRMRRTEQWSDTAFPEEQGVPNGNSGQLRT